ncbi:MAG: riboflavin biosynthesis protein RibD [Gammaproteobacteria bacterium]|nr:riboflavin biosynthesis protein RibD [Gammaproteobacteria bacterium]
MMHEIFLKRAIDLAREGKYLTKPNPMVGCVIVKDNEVIAEGYHMKYGSNHAEINALEDLNKNNNISEAEFRQLTLYCTLEPCCHHGKTGPCTDAIIKSGIKKVVIGIKDPNPKVSGSGIKQLEDNGIEVLSGFFEEELIELNKHFFFKNTYNRPYIAVKIASSADGMSHRKDNTFTWITSEQSRDDVQIVRAGFDAILTGGNTLRNDNPRMNARVDFEVNQPQKILLTSQEINKESNFFKSGDVIINRSSDLNKVVTELSNTEINSILVEAGPNLVNAFLDNHLVDEIIIYKSNITLGNEGVSWFENKTIESLGFDLKSSLKINDDSKETYIKRS